jgi:putative transposase
MRLIEKHNINKSHRFYQEIDGLCFLSKNLDNTSNYTVRQEFIHSNRYINYAANYHLVKNSVDYKALPTKVSCQIIKLVHRNWNSYVAAIEEYKIHPEKFIAKPKIPRYKDKIKGRCVLIFLSGRRVKRGLYKSAKGILINADLNGSYNILRKAIPNAIEGIEGLGVIPFRFTPGKVKL